MPTRRSLLQILLGIAIGVPLGYALDWSSRQQYERGWRDAMRQKTQASWVTPPGRPKLTPPTATADDEPDPAR